jgi:hypothetical protein
MSTSKTVTGSFGVDSSVPQKCMSHDDTWEYCRHVFPKLFDFLTSGGSLDEVWQVVNVMRSLFNENAVKTGHVKAQSEALAEKEEELGRLRDIVRRCGLMVDGEQAEKAGPTDLVSCAIPRNLADELMAEARPHIVKHGAKQLESPEVFSSTGSVSEETRARMDGQVKQAENMSRIMKHAFAKEVGSL